MRTRAMQQHRFSIVVVAVVLFLSATQARAVINGITGSTFTLTAKDGYISTPDGNSVYMWGYANGGGLMQYPGPTLIINQGATVTVNLTNTLSVPVSVVFPGQQVTASGGSAGLLTQEALPAGSPVTYTFTATHPGTYTYYSGTRPELQIEMGLFGTIIVRPATAGQAYNHVATAYDREYLFVLSEIDPTIHGLVETGQMNVIDNTTYKPVYWFINGRAAPDTLLDAASPLLPYQPYDSLPRMHPGETMLLRVVGAGRDLHPFHTHGNHAFIIARDGRLLESIPGVSGPDLQQPVFTIPSVPGETVDALFRWTGEGLGWDIYGTGPGYAHTCNGLTTPSPGFDPTTHEYCPDHGKPFPVILPELQDLTFGGFYSGSPYLGVLGSLPPGEGGLNPSAGFVFMWHSHNDKELVNFDIFPGGMLTMMIVEPPGEPIP